MDFSTLTFDGVSLKQFARDLVDAIADLVKNDPDQEEFAGWTTSQLWMTQDDTWRIDPLKINDQLGWEWYGEVTTARMLAMADFVEQTINEGLPVFSYYVEQMPRFRQAYSREDHFACIMEMFCCAAAKLLEQDDYVPLPQAISV